MNNIAEAVTALQMVLEEERYRAMPSGELLKKYLNERDEAAFAALVGRYGRLVMRRCRDVLPWEDLAQEAFQETFQQLIVRAHTVSRRGSVGAWLVATARRRALNIARRERRQRARDLGAPPQPPEPDVAQTVADREAGTIVAQVLSALPDRFRLPLELVYVDGMTHDEASRVLNWPKGTVDSYVRRGLVRLKRNLAKAGVPAAAIGALGIGTTAEAVPSSWLQAVLRAAGMVSPRPVGGVVASVAAAGYWIASKKGVVALAAIVGIVGGGLLLRAAIDSNDHGALSSGASVPSPPEESLPDKNLRLLRTVVAPKVREALKPLAQGGGDVVVLETDAYDSRVHCLLEGRHLSKPPGFGDKSRAAFFFDVGTRETSVFLDKLGNGAWQPVNPNRPIVLLRIPSLNWEWTIKLKELQQAIAAFEEIPHDPRAEAEVAQRRRQLRERLLTEFVGTWRLETNPAVRCQVELVEPLGLKFTRSTDAGPFLVLSGPDVLSCEIASRARTVKQEGLLHFVGVRLTDDGRTMFFNDGLRWKRGTPGIAP